MTKQEYKDLFAIWPEEDIITVGELCTAAGVDHQRFARWVKEDSDFQQKSLVYEFYSFLLNDAGAELEHLYEVGFVITDSPIRINIGSLDPVYIEAAPTLDMIREKEQTGTLAHQYSPSLKYFISLLEGENSAEYDLMYGCLGNGTTVWNRKQERNGDYETIANISPTGKISYYRVDLPQWVRIQIDTYSRSMEFSHQGYIVRLFQYSVTQGAYYLLDPTTRQQYEYFSMERRNCNDCRWLLTKEEIKEQIDGYVQQSHRAFYQNYYLRFKEQHPDYVILVRDHQGYSLFAEDAALATQILGLPSKLLPLDSA